ncbi:hypothetical protein SLEP1_g22587 [Rubroshorea leprosula]|uniref:Uncharacterized protein n=1 Tax=Rubroshorea leprosula TaxID=152421 RepID=A0AAV5JFQ6_9ROSI|nr:hypothetical protein SLEP1_g22587 [Rubroshorea leprosula]
MAGVEGDGVPITVLEVEVRNERCYDVDADIVFEVREYESKFGTKDSLGYLVETYEISSRVLVRLAGVKESACSAPRDHWMLMYAHYLATGLRFPIPELLGGRGGEASEGRGDLVNIMYLTSLDCIKAAELYGLSALNEAEMDKFLSVCEQLQKEKDKLEKKNKEMQEALDEVVQEKEIRKMKEAMVELKKNVQLLVHNGMEEHITNFNNSILFDNIIKLRWDHDEEGHTDFPLNFDFEFVAVEEEEVEAEGAELEESQPPLPVEVHLVPSEEEQPPFSANQQPPQPPPSAE